MFSEMLLPLSYQRICVNSYGVFVLPVLNLFSILRLFSVLIRSEVSNRFPPDVRDPDSGSRHGGDG